MAVVKKAAFYTLGCKLNFSETSTISRDFTNEGFQRVDFSDPADVYVINTCSVTQNADKRFKSIVKQAQKANPDAFIAAIGCYAQLQPQQLADVNGVDLVLEPQKNLTSHHTLTICLPIQIVGPLVAQRFILVRLKMQTFMWAHTQLVIVPEHF